ncbi:uncharacterized protein LOC115742825 [Rhodamnia argentea]|uniref:Uncharacterized protein LOC115742825 n=1 Tax=Rhodamnia argentea TaxID=178133 RepID=A0A8B8PET8_9MYRT|nr:uncharacterized protein LOC115742825 [Rhodamnia argentea]
MSGGVGPINDISLPKDDRRHPTTPPSSTTIKSGFLSFRQLNSLAVIVVLAASGLVGFQDLAFLVLSLVYIYVLSVVAFPCLGPGREPTVFNPRNRVLRLYVSFAAVIGLFLPIAYIFEGIYEGDKEGIAAAAPHLFLLASQVFMEGVAFSARFSTPIRVFVPVSYNARRIFTLMEWLESEFGKEGGDRGGSARRVYVGRILAAANMALWCFNLFAFLLPVYMPKAFKKYYAAYYNVKDV